MSAAVIWLTGRPAAGKSTLALRVRDELRERGEAVLVLDSDELRDAVEPRYGYSKSSRDAFYSTLANLAALLAEQGHVVLVAATANHRRYRNRARERAPLFVEVFVDTPLSICKDRDPKGLYASASASNANQLPGVGAAYEVPEAAEVVIRPDDEGREVAMIVEALDAVRVRG